ncbi:hypothetical protein GPK34_00575 [Secundilactobacillus kimchicus]|uniref:hypothetical protein n=1 Tax=Secundilactobacillus kimchicus TaxID=528209 RepID=UPI001C02A403|nr:hypothetical protein [Secundilactobacillus kimchicus]MBT9670532.1 hypothetical protein [Secundilactobacillus kimchicus]
MDNETLRVNKSLQLSIYQAPNYYEFTYIQPDSPEAPEAWFGIQVQDGSTFLMTELDDKCTNLVAIPDFLKAVKAAMNYVLHREVLD